MTNLCVPKCAKNAILGMFCQKNVRNFRCKVAEGNFRLFVGGVPDSPPQSGVSSHPGLVWTTKGEWMVQVVRVILGGESGGTPPPRSPWSLLRSILGGPPSLGLGEVGSQ